MAAINSLFPVSRVRTPDSLQPAIICPATLGPFPSAYATVLETQLRHELRSCMTYRPPRPCCWGPRRSEYAALPYRPPSLSQLGPPAGPLFERLTHRSGLFSSRLLVLAPEGESNAQTAALTGLPSCVIHATATAPVEDRQPPSVRRQEGPGAVLRPTGYTYRSVPQAAVAGQGKSRFTRSRLSGHILPTARGACQLVPIRSNL